MKHRLSIKHCALALLASVITVPGIASAGPDLDGSVRALWAIPLEASGDAIGAAGLITASVTGVAGDIVAVIDNNEYSKVVLRGIASMPIRRTALGISQLSTGALEGFRDSNFEQLPESEATYLAPDDVATRARTFGMGLGALGLVMVDSLTNTGLVFTRAVGAVGANEALESAQTDARSAWIGSATRGTQENKVIAFFR